MRVKLLLAICYITTSNSFSQNCDFIIEDSLLSNIVFSSDTKPIFVDIDNDGDLDAFIGDGYGNISFYKNAGSSTNAVFSKQSGSNNPLDGMNVGSYSAPTFADIDNDGDLDLFIGEGYGSIIYYKNTGSSTNAVFSKQSGGNNPLDGVDVGSYSAPSFADIDNDGDVDAFIGEYDGNINFYKNTGSSTNAVFSKQSGSNNPFNGVYVGYRSALTFADIDNDGDLDAFIGEYNGNINYYKNTGSSTNADYSLQSGSNNPLDGVDVGSYSSPAFVDIDYDDDVEAFIGDYYGNISFYKNTGSPTNAVFNKIGSNNPIDGVDVGSDIAPTFADIDYDGDFDLFFGENWGSIIYYKNTGSSTNAVFSLQIGSNNPLDGVDVGSYSAPAFADIDNDGDLDLFIGEWYGSISYYKNTGSTINAVFSLQNGSNNPFSGVYVGYRSALTFGDIDNDGDLDAFIGEYDGNINYYKNTGSSTNADYSLQSGSNNPLDGVNVMSYFSTPAFIDIDNDGDLDLINGELYGSIIYYKNTGSSTNAVFSLQSGSDNPWHGVNVGPYSTPAFTDINNDGDLDLFIGEFDGHVNFIENKCSSLVSTDIEKIDETKCFTLYPNPTQSSFKLDIHETAFLHTYQLQLFDVLGKQILTQILQENNTINMRNKPAGFYLVKIITEEGKSYTGSILLQ